MKMLSKMKTVLMGNRLKPWMFYMSLVLLFILVGAWGQPPVQEFDKRIVASEFFKDEWGDSYGICEVPRLSSVSDVNPPFTGGQCLKRNPGNTAWVGGQCGTGGGSGFDFDSASADQQHNWVFPIGQKPLTASINFTTGACPTGWGTNCWSAEPRAIVGSYSGVNGGAPPSDIVLLSNTRIAYASATDKRATSVWVGSTQYPVEFIAHNGTLGVREVVYSTLQTAIPGTNWQNVRFEFSDGSFSPATEGSLVQRTADKEELIDYLGLQGFSPSQGNIYPPTKAILKSGTNISLDHSDTNNTITINSTATGGSSSSEGVGRFIALPAVPTDLTSYPNGQILRIQPPPTTAVPDPDGEWREVLGADAGELHSFRTLFEADSTNPARALWAVGTDLNYGYSSFGDVFGELYTADGGKAFTASNTPIMRMEIEQEVATVTPNVGGNIYGFTTTYTLLIRKTDLATAPATIYVRYYTGPPASGNQVTTVQFSKGADNSAHAYHTYIDSSGADILTEDILSIKYFSLFTSNPPTGDQLSNPLNFHEAKTTVVRDPPPADWAKPGNTESIPLAKLSNSPDRLFIGSSFPASPKTGDVFIFDTDVASGLDWRVPGYTDGAPQRVWTTTNRYVSPSIISYGYSRFGYGLCSWVDGSSQPYNNNYFSFVASQRGSNLFCIRNIPGKTLKTLTVNGTSRSNLTVNQTTSQYIRYNSPFGYSSFGRTSRIQIEFTDGTFYTWLSNTVGAISSAKKGDIAKFDGTRWVRQTISFAEEKTPRRVSRLPPTASSVKGEEVYVTADYTTTNPVATIKAEKYVFNGVAWVVPIPQQFRSDADTTGQLFQPKCFWLGTSTQLTAATKTEGCMYMVPKTSQ